MKILVFSDTHATRSSEFARPTSDGYNEYLQLWKKSMEFVRKQAEEFEPDVIVFNGDLWEARDYVDTMSMSVAVQEFGRLSTYPCYKIAVAGNHDFYSVSHDIHNLEFLRSQGWQVFSRPESLLVEDKKFLIVPYRDDYSDTDLSVILGKPHDVAFTHFDVIGGRFRAQKSETDFNALCGEGLAPELFNNVQQVFNGHFHHPSWVTKNFYNVGSLTTRTFHDKGSSSRGIVLYDTESGVTECIPNPHARPFTEIWVEDEEALGEVLSQDYSQTYAKLHFPPELEESVQSSKDFFAGVRLLPHKRKAENSVLDVNLQFSLYDNFVSYVESNYEDEASALIRVGSKLLEEAERSSGGYRAPIEFDYLAGENFQSFGKVQFDLRNRGVVFLRGINADDPEQDSNGSGKSSLIELIYWVLTGKSLRGHKANDIIRWGASSCRGELGLTIGDKSYIIKRGRKDPELKNGVKIYIDGEDASARLATDTETKVIDLLGRTDKNLKHICFMTADLTNRFSALSRNERANLLEDIIDSKAYTVAQEGAKKLKLSAKSRLDSITGSIESYADVRDEYKARIDELANEIKAEKTKSAPRTDELNKQLSDISSKEDSLRSKVSQLEQWIAERTDEEKLLWSKKSELDDLARKVQSEIAGPQSEYAAVEAEMRRLNNLAAKSCCPECGRPMDRVDLSSRVEAQKIATQGLQKVIAEGHSKLESLTNRRNQVSDKLREKSASKVSAVNELASTGRNIENYISMKSEIEKRLTSVEESWLRLEDLRVSTEKELYAVDGKLDELLNEEVTLKEDYNIYRILQDEVFDERGARTSILAQVAIPYINSRIPVYAEYMLGGRDLEISPQDFSISMAGKRTYTASSSGERRRVDLLIQFVLNDLAVATGRSKIGLLAVDEVLDKLDEPGIYAVKRVLESKAEGMTILMTSHVKYAASIMTNQITLVKRDNVTEITV